jgi:hypothetical protein
MTTKNLSPALPATKQVRSTAMVVLAGVLYFATVIVALHFLRPDFNPISRPTSEYAVGPYGFLMTPAFFSMSLATFALVMGLVQGVSPSARSRVGLTLLGLWGVGVLIAMIFPINLDGAPQTLAGTIHGINGPLAFLSATIGLLLVSRRFKQDDRWRPFHRTSLILSLVLLAGFVGTFLSFITESGFLGLTQRITLAAIVTWMLLTAVHLRSVAVTYVRD